MRGNGEYDLVHLDLPSSNHLLEILEEWNKALEAISPIYEPDL